MFWLAIRFNQVHCSLFEYLDTYGLKIDKLLGIIDLTAQSVASQRAVCEQGLSLRIKRIITVAAAIASRNRNRIQFSCIRYFDEFGLSQKVLN